MGLGISIDVFVAIVILFSMMKGWTQGFTQTVVQFVSTCLSVIVAVVLAKPVAVFILNNYVYDWLIRTASGIISEYANVDSLVQNIEVVYAQFPAILQTFLFNGTESVASILSTHSRDISEHFVQILLVPGVLRLLTCGCFGVLFIVLQIIFGMICNILGIVKKIPVIKDLDAILGLCFGLLKSTIIMAALVVCSYYLLDAIAPQIDGFDIGMLKESYVVSFLVN